MPPRLQAEPDIRRRIGALIGKIEKPSTVLVQRSIQPLLDKLERERSYRAANTRLAEQHMKQIARIHKREVKVSRNELAATKAYRAALVKRGRSIVIQPPRVTAVPPQIKSGSILSVDVPPYSSPWTDGTSGDASFLNGTWSTGSNDNDHSYAGVCCSLFNPLPGVFPVRFAPYMPISFAYVVDTYSSYLFPWGFSRASAMGFVGVFVSGSRDGGVTWEVVRDNRALVFEQSVSVNDNGGDSGDAIVPGTQAEFMTFTKPVLFALWAWGGVVTSKRDGPGPGFGFAQAKLAASIPFIVIEQKI